MKTTLIAVAAAALALCGGYYIGYERGHRVESAAHAVLGLKTNLKLYRLIERGDTNSVVGRLREAVYLDTDYYDKHHGDCRSEWLTTSFISDLQEARVIADEVRSQMSAQK